MLATQLGLSSKVVSERHFIASQTKLTAGEAARKISKARKVKVTAKEVQEFCTEWHHSGFYRANGRKTMGRTWFISVEKTEDLIANWEARKAELQAKKDAEAATERRRQETIVRGFFYRWDYNYSGRYGRKQHFKVLEVYEGPEAARPRNFTPCNEQQFEKAKAAAGRKYFGWDEPKSSEF